MSDLFTILQRQYDGADLGPDQWDRRAENAHKGLHDDGEHVPVKLRDAAVLIAITERAEPGILLTVRPDTMPTHPGQVAFPGGKIEAGETAIEAALREAEEELSIPPRAVQIIGEGASFATGSGFRLTPVLGVISADLAVKPDPREVADWFEAPLSFLLNRANHEQKSGLFAGHERRYTQMIWQEYRIWGITAGIIANLSHRLDWKDLQNV